MHNNSEEDGQRRRRRRRLESQTDEECLSLCLNKAIKAKLDDSYLLRGRLGGTSVVRFGPRVLTSGVTLTTAEGNFHPHIEAEH